MVCILGGAFDLGDPHPWLPLTLELEPPKGGAELDNGADTRMGRTPEARGAKGAVVVVEVLLEAIVKTVLTEEDLATPVTLETVLVTTQLAGRLV